MPATDTRRPVVIFGPGRDAVTDVLLSDYAAEFNTCVPHTTRPRQADEVDGETYHFITEDELFAGVKRGVFMEVVPFDGHWYAFSVEALRKAMQAAPQGGCILDIADPNTLVVLESFGIVPVVVLLETDSLDAVRATCGDVSDEKAQDMLTLASLIKHDFATEISETIYNAGHLVQLARQTRTTLVEAQSKPYWSPKTLPVAPVLNVEELKASMAEMDGQAPEASGEAQAEPAPEPAASTKVELRQSAASAAFVPDPSAMQPREITDADMWCTETIKLKRGYGGLGFSFAGGAYVRDVGASAFGVAVACDDKC